MRSAVGVQRASKACAQLSTDLGSERLRPFLLDRRRDRRLGGNIELVAVGHVSDVDVEARLVGDDCAGCQRKDGHCRYGHTVGDEL
jgi:hypothetical protein